MESTQHVVTLAIQNGTLFHPATMVSYSIATAIKQ